MKKNTVLIVFLSFTLLLVSCNKEEPLPTKVEFTTNLNNNNLIVGEGFRVYLNDVKGEFLAYFKGDSPESSWPDGFGKTFEINESESSSEPDSISISAYNEAGTYTFTIVATSYGNWGETMEQAFQSIEISVADAK